MCLQIGCIDENLPPWLMLGDCLERMKEIPDGSVDMILADLPYGTTTCKWDVVIPFEPLWEQYKRIIKTNGAIALFGTQPFSSSLVMSNVEMFRYEWIWEKTLATNFHHVKKQPAKKHEQILIFYKHQPKYYPHMEIGKPYIDKVRKRTEGYFEGRETQKLSIQNTGTRYPSTVQKFSNGNNKNAHPTQKPIALLDYLIKTYTNENEVVLDNVMGSGSTGVACMNTGRKFIGIEKDEMYFQIAEKRISFANTTTYDLISNAV